MNDEKNLTLKEAFNLAVKNHQNKNLQDAQNYYYKVLKIDPNFLSAHNNLGATFKELGELQKAKECYEKTIEIDPGYVKAHNNLGVILQEFGELQKAKECYEKAIEIDPNYADAHNNLGTTFKELGELQKAKSCYEKAIEINPNSNMALFNRGEILFEEEKFELSLMDFDNCNTSDSRYRALISLYALGHIDEIYKRIEKNSQLDEKNLKVAAFSSFIAYKKKKKYCPKFLLKPNRFYTSFESFITFTKF